MAYQGDEFERFQRSKGAKESKFEHEGVPQTDVLHLQW